VLVAHAFALGEADRHGRAYWPGAQCDHDPEAQRENQDRTHHRAR
jgi:hypothetical protein